MKFIRLTGGYWATVDAEDYDRVKRWNWYARKSQYGCYAARSMTLPGGKRKTRFLHHEVLGREPGGGLVVDHINRDKLDCRKGNLRICTRGQNNINRGPRRDSRRSKYKEVTYSKPHGVHRGGWTATIRFDRRVYYLGFFDDEHSAVKAYNVWAYRLHGKYAYLNAWNGPTQRLAGDPLNETQKDMESGFPGKMCAKQ